MSRLHGGIHYPIDLDSGEAIAAKLAQRALQSGPVTGQVFTPAGR